MTDINHLPARGLVIGPSWADLIVNGQKTWELRKRPTNIRGEFAVIAKGTGAIVGAVELTHCIGPLGLSELMEHRDLAHESELEIIDDIKNGYVYAWVLSNAKHFDPPVRYKHPSGAVTWVNLSPDRLTL